MSNPPFHRPGSATPPRTATGRAAHLATASSAPGSPPASPRLRQLGRLTLIHRADQLDVILAALAGRAGDVIVLPALARGRRPMPPSGCIVAARKAARARSGWRAGLVLHEPDGRFTPAAEAILRDGAALPL